MTALLSNGDGKYRCGHHACGASLVKCDNYALEHVCNRCCAMPVDRSSSETLCDYCRFNDTIPDLSVAGNREHWRKLETAKRRLLYTLDLLQLPYGDKADGMDPPLSFDFKTDQVKERRWWWWSMGEDERVYTGHANGKIVINLREADSVEREKTRVAFQEAHRTLIGHFRHEIAHYYWDMLVRNRSEPAFKQVFGDHENPSYGDAQKHYYEQGPVKNWPTQFVSAYASMHPWEDFAETFATYVNIVSVLDTAHNASEVSSVDPLQTDLSVMVDRYVQLGIVVNEMNRAMGLFDLVPEILVPPVVVKMQFVHDLLRRSRKGQQAQMY